MDTYLLAKGLRLLVVATVLLLLVMAAALVARRERRRLRSGASAQSPCGASDAHVAGSRAGSRSGGR